MNPKTAFRDFLKEEVKKVKGVYYPVKAGFLRRVFIKSAPCSRLHPNPYDEFCFPDIGPNQEIISRYEQEYRAREIHQGSVDYKVGGTREPVMVEKTRPDGYMILNGHHRWAAALRIGMKKIRISIIDLTREEDIRNMLRNGKSSRRATLDLDEVVFGPADAPGLESPLRFPLNRIYRERLRLGIPALFHTLNMSGYDIWIYTRNYYSLDYLRYYFRHHHLHVTGIVTGTERKGADGGKTRQELSKLFDSKYESTLHIDSQAVIRSFTGSRSFDEFPLSGSNETWAREVAEIVEKMK